MNNSSAGGCDRHTKTRPRGASPCPRSGAEAGRTPCPKGSGQEELPHVQGQGQQPRVPDCDCAGMTEKSYPASEVRGGGPEEIPSIRGQGRRREELPFVRGQGRLLGGDTLRPKPEARGGGREELPHAHMPPCLRPGAWPGGATPRPYQG